MLAALSLGARIAIGVWAFAETFGFLSNDLPRALNKLGDVTKTVTGKVYPFKKAA
jgi:hypothetical protein